MAEQQPYEAVRIEISGDCNAKCPYCPMGNYSLPAGKRPHMPVATFAGLVDDVLRRGLLRPQSSVELYNWNEPLMHPDLPGILIALQERGLQAEISTNAYRVVKLPPGLAATVGKLTFSMPGFSQASYDKIHMLKFEKVCASIVGLLADWRAGGFTAVPELSFHVYRFSAPEMPAAKAFCLEHGIRFCPRPAQIGIFDMSKEFFTGTMAPEKVAELKERFYLDRIPEWISKQPADYECHEFRRLVITDHGEVATCCALPRGHEQRVVGDLAALSNEEIAIKKRSQPICKDCIGCGQAYWWETNYEGFPYLPAPPLPGLRRLLPAAVKGKLKQVVPAGVFRAIGWETY